MPKYNFKCSECEHRGDVWTGDREKVDVDYKDIECPGCGKKTYNYAPWDNGGSTSMKNNWGHISPMALGRQKAPADFRNFLTQVKKAHPGSTIRDH